MSDLIERLRAVSDLSDWANRGWDIPGSATAKLRDMVREAADELERLRAELATAQSVIADFPAIEQDLDDYKLRAERAEAALANPLLTGMNIGNGTLDIGLEGAGPQLIAGMFLGMFEKYPDAKNYIEVTFDSSQGPLLVTVVKPGGKTPHQARREAEAERDSFAHDVLRLIATINYLTGIAVRGEGRPIRSDETPEQFVLEYVKRIEAERDALLELLKEVSSCFTRDDDLPDNLVPRIDAAMRGKEAGNG